MKKFTTITFPTVDPLGTTDVKPMVSTQEELTTFYKRLPEGKSAELVGMTTMPAEMSEPTFFQDLEAATRLFSGLIEQCLDEDQSFVQTVIKDLSQAMEFKIDGNKSLRNQLRFCLASVIAKKQEVINDV